SCKHRYHETTCGGRIPGLPSTPELTRAAERDRGQACSAAALLLVQELSSRPTARLADRRGFDDRESLRSCCQSVAPVRGGRTSAAPRENKCPSAHRLDRFQIAQGSRNSACRQILRALGPFLLRHPRSPWQGRSRLLSLRAPPCQCRPAST